MMKTTTMMDKSDWINGWMDNRQCLFVRSAIQIILTSLDLINSVYIELMDHAGGFALMQVLFCLKLSCFL